MSRYTVTILCLVLLAHLVGYGTTSTMADQEGSSSALANSNTQSDQANGNNNREQNFLLDGQATNQRANPRAHQTTKSLDLIELTPSLEQQLYQAKRLNGGDPGSLIELAKLANDAYRYDIANELNDAPDGRTPQMAQSRQWIVDGVRMLNGARRMTNNNNNDNYGRVSIGDDSQKRFSRGLKVAAFGGSRAEAASNSRMANDDEQDKDYGSLVGVSQPSSSASAIDNQESASRKSLWTSELLRDLLIAQEARNRARLIEKLTRAYEREQGANQNPISAVVGQNTDKGANREKRRRCKVDPNLGVKNPSFCDTDAYFGAADYSMRDVWDSAGR